MKDLKSYVKEANDVDVYVVRDVDDTVIGIFDSEEAANNAKKNYEITPDMKAVISREDRAKWTSYNK